MSQKNNNETPRAGEAFLAKYKKNHDGKRPELRFFSENRQLLKAIQSHFESERLAWETKYGESFPVEIDDWLRWLSRAEVWRYMPAEKIASGKMTGADILPYLEGYLQNLADKKAADKNPPKKSEAMPPGDKAAKPANTNTTPPGGARLKIVSALTKHHKYATDSCLNTEPVGVNSLARMAEVSSGSVTEFFKKNFGGHGKYQVICRTPATLANYLKAINAGFCPFATFAKTPGEYERDDD